MAVASERLAAPAISAPTRWRGRPAQVGLILLVMLAAFALWRGEFPWPSWLTWTALPGRLDDLQGWLLDERTAEDPNLIFAIFDGFRALADWLVTSFTDALEWMTWVGVTAAGTLLVLALRRLAGRPHGAGRLRRVRADGPVGAEHADARADVRRGAPLADHRRPGRDLGRAQRARAPRAHAGARRDADRAGVRLPHAGRDPVLRRPGRRGDLHDDLRRPARRAHHGAGDPRRHRRHRRGLQGARRDADADALQGAAAAGAQAAAAGAQPDDHVRALARGDRGADRRPRAGRRRHQRPLLERRARAARRRRDRRDGDRARPRDRRDRRAHGPDAPPPDRRRQAAGAQGDAGGAGGDRGDRRDLPRARRRAVLSRRVRDRELRVHGHARGPAAELDPVRARLCAGSDVVRVRHHRADRQLPRRVRARAAARVARGDAVVRDDRRVLRRSRSWSAGCAPRSPSR